MRRAAQVCTLALAICLGAAAGHAAPTGFADLPRLIAVHPLHKVLDAYDREIAALRATRAAPGLGDPAARAGDAATVVRRDVAEAQGQVQRIASAAQRAIPRSRSPRAVRRRRVALRRQGRRWSAYAVALARETGAS